MAIYGAKFVPQAYAGIESYEDQKKKQKKLEDAIAAANGNVQVQNQPSMGAQPSEDQPSMGAQPIPDWMKSTQPTSPAVPGQPSMGAQPIPSWMKPTAYDQSQSAYERAMAELTGKAVAATNAPVENLFSEAYQQAITPYEQAAIDARAKIAALKAKTGIMAGATVWRPSERMESELAQKKGDIATQIALSQQQLGEQIRQQRLTQGATLASEGIAQGLSKAQLDLQKTIGLGNLDIAQKQQALAEFTQKRSLELQERGLSLDEANSKAANEARLAELTGKVASTGEETLASKQLGLETEKTRFEQQQSLADYNLRIGELTGEFKGNETLAKQIADAELALKDRGMKSEEAKSVAEVTSIISQLTGTVLDPVSGKTKTTLDALQLNHKAYVDSETLRLQEKGIDETTARQTAELNWKSAENSLDRKQQQEQLDLQMTQLMGQTEPTGGWKAGADTLAGKKERNDFNLQWSKNLNDLAMQQKSLELQQAGMNQTDAQFYAKLSLEANLAKDENTLRLELQQNQGILDSLLQSGRLSAEDKRTAAELYNRIVIANKQAATAMAVGDSATANSLIAAIGTMVSAGLTMLTKTAKIIPTTPDETDTSRAKPVFPNPFENPEVTDNTKQYVLDMYNKADGSQGAPTKAMVYEMAKSSLKKQGYTNEQIDQIWNEIVVGDWGNPPPGNPNKNPFGSPGGNADQTASGGGGSASGAGPASGAGSTTVASTPQPELKPPELTTGNYDTPEFWQNLLGTGNEASAQAVADLIKSLIGNRPAPTAVAPIQPPPIDVVKPNTFVIPPASGNIGQATAPGSITPGVPVPTLGEQQPRTGEDLAFQVSADGKPAPTTDWTLAFGKTKQQAIAAGIPEWKFNLFDTDGDGKISIMDFGVLQKRFTAKRGGAS